MSFVRFVVIYTGFALRSRFQTLFSPNSNTPSNRLQNEEKETKCSNARFKIKLNLSKKISKWYRYQKCGSQQTHYRYVSVLCFDKNTFRSDVYGSRPFWVPKGIYNWLPNVLVAYMYTRHQLYLSAGSCVFSMLVNLFRP